MATTIYPVVFSINKYKPTHLNLDLNIYTSESSDIHLENKQMFGFKKNYKINISEIHFISYFRFRK